MYVGRAMSSSWILSHADEAVGGAPVAVRRCEVGDPAVATLGYSSGPALS